MCNKNCIQRLKIKKEQEEEEDIEEEGKSHKGNVCCFRQQVRKVEPVRRRVGGYGWDNSFETFLLTLASSVLQSSTPRMLIGQTQEGHRSQNYVMGKDS